MRNIKITIGTTIILFILMKLIVPDLKNNKEDSQQFWLNKTYAPDIFDIVVCGDSRVYRGVSIDALLSGIDKKVSAINLGYSSAGLSDAYIDFALSKFNPNSTRKVLVIGITPHTLTAEGFKNLDLQTYLDLKPFEIFKYKYLSGILRYVSPYKLSEIQGNGALNHQEEYMNNGWISSFYLKPDSTSALESYRHRFSKYQVSKKEVTLFIQKIKKITSKGIKVVAYRPPSTAQMRELEDSLSGFDEIIIKKQLIDNAVIWFDFKDDDFESYDGSHLHKNSAKKLSKIIGEKIDELCLIE